jgi:hypothetical protein
MNDQASEEMARCPKEILPSTAMTLEEIAAGLRVLAGGAQKARITANDHNPGPLGKIWAPVL